MQSGKTLNCKAYVSIARQHALKNFLKQEVLPQLSNSDTSKGKSQTDRTLLTEKLNFCLERIKILRNSTSGHKLLNAWPHSSSHTSTAPLDQLQLSWLSD